jgi:hypothetical protein
MAVPPPDKYRAQLACCRPTQEDHGDKALREALGRLKGDPALQESFTAQAQFDERLAALVREVPLPATFDDEIQAGLRRNTPVRSTWRGLARQPALWAVILAFGFLVAWGANMLYQRATGFPGDDTVSQLAQTAIAGPGQQPFEPLTIASGKLGDTLFLKYGIDDYQVPAAFEHLEATGYRVFDHNGAAITQVQLRAHDMAFLIFRADALGVDIQPPGDWKFLTGDQWAAAAEVHNGVCFVALCRGDRDQLESYMYEAQTASTASQGVP